MIYDERHAGSHVLDEAERSLHDALCVLQQTVQDSRVIYGGGYPEMQMAKVPFTPPLQADGMFLPLQILGSVTRNLHALLSAIACLRNHAHSQHNVCVAHYGHPMLNQLLMPMSASCDLSSGRHCCCHRFTCCTSCILQHSVFPLQGIQSHPGWVSRAILSGFGMQVVEEKAQRTPGKKSLAIEAYARALRAIPGTICDNAGKQ